MSRTGVEYKARDEVKTQNSMREETALNAKIKVLTREKQELTLRYITTAQWQLLQNSVYPPRK